MRRITKMLVTALFPLLLAVVVADTTVLGTAVILLSVFDRGGNVVHHIGKFWSRMNLCFSLVRVRVKGLEHIEKGRPYVLMSNHQSYYDVWALIGHVPLQLRWVIKKELRRVPIFGFGCERMGHIFVDRGDNEKARRSLEAAGGKIRAGASVVFFPEGTRSRDGRLLPFKKGGFAVALAAGVPILPVTVTGSRRVLPRGALVPSPGPIEITIHPPVPVEGYTHDTKEALMARIRAAIESGLA